MRRLTFICCRLPHRSLPVDARPLRGAGNRTVSNTAEREHQSVDKWHTPHGNETGIIRLPRPAGISNLFRCNNVLSSDTEY